MVGKFLLESLIEIKPVVKKKHLKYVKIEKEILLDLFGLLKFRNKAQNQNFFPLKIPLEVVNFRLRVSWEQSASSYGEKGV